MMAKPPIAQTNFTAERPCVETDMIEMRQFMLLGRG